MSSLPVGASNSPSVSVSVSLSSQIRQERWGGRDSGEYQEGGERERERDEQQTTEGAVSREGKWGWKDKGMRSEPPGSCINFFNTTHAQDGMGWGVVAADGRSRPISPAPCLP